MFKYVYAEKWDRWSPLHALCFSDGWEVLRNSLNTVMRKDLVTRGKQCKHSSQGGAPRACVFLQAAIEPPGRRVGQGRVGGNQVHLGDLALCLALWRMPWWWGKLFQSFRPCDTLKKKKSVLWGFVFCTYAKVVACLNLLRNDVII